MLIIVHHLAFNSSPFKFLYLRSRSLSAPELGAVRLQSGVCVSMVITKSKHLAPKYTARVIKLALRAPHGKPVPLSPAARLETPAVAAERVDRASSFRYISSEPLDPERESRTRRSILLILLASVGTVCLMHALFWEPPPPRDEEKGSARIRNRMRRAH